LGSEEGRAEGAESCLGCRCKQCNRPVANAGCIEIIFLAGIPDLADQGIVCSDKPVRTSGHVVFELYFVALDREQKGMEGNVNSSSQFTAIEIVHSAD
jgi:hypothetical protein